MRIGKDVTITEKDKKVAKVIHRLVSEECTKLTTLAGKISTLNFQAQNFHMMDEVIQDGVLEDIKKIMLDNGWSDWVKELKDEFVFCEKSEVGE